MTADHADEAPALVGGRGERRVGARDSRATRELNARRRALATVEVNGAAPEHEALRVIAEPRFGPPGERQSPSIAELERRAGVRVGAQLDADLDFDRFDWLIAMDRANEMDLLDAGAPEGKVRLLRSFDPALQGQSGRALDVPDPYGEGADAFERMWATIEPGCRGLLDRLCDGMIGG